MMNHMKTFTMIIVSGAAALLLASCSTTDKAAATAQTADTYEPVQLPAGAGTAIAVPAQQPAQLVEGADPVELGNSSVFMYSMGGLDVSQNTAYYYYWPASGEICMRLSGLTVKSYVLFDHAVRSVCRQAFGQYESDFDAHGLRKNSDTYRAYGEAAGHFKWGLLGPSNETKPKMTVGYKFVKGSPYFTLTLWPARGEFKNQAQRDDVAGSDRTTILMTRKQAADMIGFMDENAIAEIVAKMNTDTVKGDKY